MAFVLAVCSRCKVPFNNEANKPLMSACGHTYCTNCWREVKRSSNRCPNCAKHIDSKLDKIPVNLSLIPQTEDKITPVLKCPSHEKKMENWCADCSTLACRDCHIQSHPVHRTIFLESFKDNHEAICNEIQSCRARIQSCLTGVQESKSACKFINDHLLDGLNKIVQIYTEQLANEELTVTLAKSIISETRLAKSVDNGELVVALSVITQIRAFEESHQRIKNIFVIMQNYEKETSISAKVGWLVLVYN